MMVRGPLGQWGPPAYGPLVDWHDADPYCDCGQRTWGGLHAVTCPVYPIAKYELIPDPHNTDALLVRVDALEARVSDLEAYCKAIVKHVETNGQDEAR